MLIDHATRSERVYGGETDASARLVKSESKCQIRISIGLFPSGGK